MIAARSTSVAVQVRRTPVARGVAPSQLQRIHVQVIMPDTLSLYQSFSLPSPHQGVSLI